MRTDWPKNQSRSAGFFSVAGALNPVEKLPPHFQRSLDGGPHSCALDFAHWRVTENVVADAAVIAIRDFMHVEKCHLLARESVLLFECARERSEVARHLALRRQIDSSNSLRERPVLGRKLEPVDQRRGRRKGLAMDHVGAAEPESEAEPDEQFRMRRAAG